MRQMLASFYRDERGSVLLTEWLFMTTILMIGILAPLVVRLWSSPIDPPGKTLATETLRYGRLGK